MKSCVVIATHPIADGEELFMDYRLNPAAGNLPDWYSPFDPKETERRWSIQSSDGLGSSIPVDARQSQR